MRSADLDPRRPTTYAVNLLLNLLTGLGVAAILLGLADTLSRIHQG